MPIAVANPATYATVASSPTRMSRPTRRRDRATTVAPSSTIGQIPRTSYATSQTPPNSPGTDDIRSAAAWSIVVASGAGTRHTIDTASVPISTKTSEGRRARGASLADEKIRIVYRRRSRCGRRAGASTVTARRVHRPPGPADERRIAAMGTIDVALEVGRTRTFATALAWPGWCRGGRDEVTALDALAERRDRYAAILRSAGRRPPGAGDLRVVERLPGTASTEFGAPNTAPTADAADVDAAELARLIRLLRACWDAFDRTVADAEGATLRTGPRGGGRPLDAIRDHVAGAQRGYLTTLGGSPKGLTTPTEVRAAFVDALGRRARGELPDEGPRGGTRWSARFAVRYTAWHTTDHLWEIEDRVVD